MLVVVWLLRGALISSRIVWLDRDLLCTHPHTMASKVTIPPKLHHALVDLIRNHTPQIKYDLTHLNKLSSQPSSSDASSTSTSTTTTTTTSQIDDDDDQRVQDAERVAAALSESARVFVAHVHRNEFDRIGADVADAAVDAVTMAMRRAQLDHGWNHVRWREATVVSLLLVAFGRVGEGRLIEALEALDTALMLDDQIDDLARALVKVLDGTIAATTNHVPEHLDSGSLVVRLARCMHTQQSIHPSINESIRSSSPMHHPTSNRVILAFTCISRSW